ncbi:MAG: hypothetical protein FWD82_06905 [Defluviitaleaceae bacterium]|nr:hypothetical protein [Defluviitaleaceae bacterium]
MESYRTQRTRTQYRPNNYKSRTQSAKKGQKEKASKVEILIMQSIISMIVLALAIMIRIVNTGFTNNLQENLKTSISQNETPQEAFYNASGTFSRVWVAITGFFGSGEAVVDDLGEAGDVFLATHETAGEFRIDEEILQQILNTEKK